MPNYTAISREAHASKRWQRNSSYAFAAGQAAAPVLAAEMSKAAMSLPLAFIAQGDTVTLVAALGLEDGQNLFVAPDGRWLGGYIPAALRAYPFVLANTEQGQRVLCIDAESGLLADGPAGEAFFNADGTPAPALAQVMEFLTHLDGNRGITAAACAALHARQLLVPWDITVQRDAGEQKVEGLYKVDEAALNALSDADFVTLRQSGAIGLAYCQLISMQHLATLGQLAQAHAQANASANAAAVAPPVRELDLEFLNRSGTLSFGGLV